MLLFSDRSERWSLPSSLGGSVSSTVLSWVRVRWTLRVSKGGMMGWGISGSSLRGGSGGGGDESIGHGSASAFDLRHFLVLLKRL